MVKVYISYAFLLAIFFEEIRANEYTPDIPNYININQNDLNKGKRGVASVVETVQSQHVGANVVPIPVPVHVPVPRPYPVGIPKPVGVPVGVPVAVRVAVPRPYPVPVLVDAAAATAGFEYGLGLYGGPSSLEYHTLLNYLSKANNHMGHLTGHDQHSLTHSLALAKLIH